MTQGQDWGPERWDERYLEGERLWSGQPNGTLVALVGDLGAGRVLDVGCGEGGDAVWLARQGWEVTALDPSRVALERARSHAEAARVEVTWLLGGLLDVSLPEGGFDLVSAQYPALVRTPDDSPERRLLDLVAPGGRLLVVHHTHLGDPEHGHEHEHGDGEADEDGVVERDFDPADFVQPADVARLLDPAVWTVEVDEVRDRWVHGGAGAHHDQDVVLMVRRTTS